MLCKAKLIAFTTTEVVLSSTGSTHVNFEKMSTMSRALILPFCSAASSFCSNISSTLASFDICASSGTNSSLEEDAAPPTFALRFALASALASAFAALSLSLAALSLALASAIVGTSPLASALALALALAFIFALTAAVTASSSSDLKSAT